MIVSVDALFSKNNLIGSRIIAYGTKHLAKGYPACSHTALLVNNRWVHESTGHTGVRVISYNMWQSMNTEVARIKLDSREYQEVADQYRKIKDKRYDYMGVIFLGACIFLTLIIRGLSLPKKNLLESSKHYFCCEVLGYLTGHYYGMSAPIQILKKLKG